MSKIGLMGGTFDPIHNGHIALAKQALTEFRLDRILFIPNYCPWMKSGRRIADANDRIDMVRAAIQDEPRFDLSYIEINAGGNSYTSNTVLQLKKEHPEDTYFFILGADSLFTIEQWVHPEIIFQCVTILAAVRDDCDLEALKAQKEHLTDKYHGDIRLMHMQRIEISSTYIRDHFYTSENTGKMLPARVCQIIKERQLYRDR